MALNTDLSEYENDPRLFLFTSLTAGSSHIITATSRMETILKANRIPFQAIDLATDEKARRLWQRRAQKKKLPGLVKDGFVLGDLEEVEEWSEFGELKENIGPVPASNAAPAGNSIQGIYTAPPTDHNVPGLKPATNSTLMRPIPPPIAGEETRIALPGAAEIAALNKVKKEKESAAKAPAQAVAATTADTPTTVVASSEGTGAVKETSAQSPSLHLSAPASAIQSGTATPQQAEDSCGNVTGTPMKSSEPLTVTTAAAVATTTPEPGLEPASDAPTQPSRAVEATSTPVDAAAGTSAAGDVTKNVSSINPADGPPSLHRGSAVKEATPEMIKQLEEATTLHEVADEDAEAEMAADRVSALTVNDGKPEEGQQAKAGEAAGISVED